MWLVGRHSFNQNGLPHRAHNTWDVLFPEIYPLKIFILCRKLLKNFKIGPLWVEWQTPPFVRNGPHCRAPDTCLGNFFLQTNSISIWILCRKLLKIFVIGPFWADWQTLFCQNDPEYRAQNTEVGNFSTKLTKIWILYEKLLRNFKIGLFGADRQTLIFPNWPAIWDPKYMSWQLTPLKLEFYGEIVNK